MAGGAAGLAFPSGKRTFLPRAAEREGEREGEGARWLMVHLYLGLKGMVSSSEPGRAPPAPEIKGMQRY